MSTPQTTTLLHHLRQWAAGRGDDPHSDRELLQRFATQRDESAFAAVVRRHGPMVLSVCRRILHQSQDAEDAFQATFLVLLRKAGSHRWHDTIGGWLHRVATRIALRLRTDAARRSAEVPRMEESIVADPLEQLTVRELLAAFDEELARLPERYRAPLVLCSLQGKTQEETARQLNCSLSTIRRRLERGRQILHKRLTRRGLELPAVLAAVLLSKEASAVVPPLLRMAVMQAVHGSVSARVALLADGLWRAAVLTPMKAAVAAILMLGALAAGTGLVAHHFRAAKPPDSESSANAPPDKAKSDKAERADLYGDPLPPGALLRMGTVRFRNRDILLNIAYSPDGKLLAAAGYNGAILLYDAATGTKRRRFQGDPHAIAALAFAPDSKTLASTGSRAIQIWDIAAGKELRRFDAVVSQTEHFTVPLVYSPDGKMLAFEGPDHSVRLVDANNGKESVRLKGHQRSIRYLAFSPDGKTLFSAAGEGYNKDGRVRVWAVANGKELKTFALRGGGNNPQPGKPVAFSPDGKTLAFAALERRLVMQGRNILSLHAEVVTLLDLDSGAVRRTLEPREKPFASAVFSADGKTFAAINVVETAKTAYCVNCISLWDTASGALLLELPAYGEYFGRQGPNLLAFAPDGNKLVAAAASPSLYVWNLDRGRERLDRPQSHQNLVLSIAYSPDGRTLATASSDRTLALWDAATGRQRLRLDGHEGAIQSLAFSGDGKLLASASVAPEQSVRLWDATSGKELRRYEIPMEPIGEHQYVSVSTWVAFADNGKTLAAAGTDRKVRLWDVATGKEIRNASVRGLSLPPKDKANDYWNNRVWDVALTRDGRIAALYAAKILSVVDVATGQALYHYEIGAIPTTTVLALSPDGKTLLRGADKTVRLVEAAGGAELHKLDLPATVFSAAFSADGRCVAIAAGEAGATIHLIDVPSGKELLRLHGHDARVRSLAFSPDGNHLATGQWDSTALVWDVASARRKLPRRSLAQSDLDRFWTDLKDANAVKAHAALWTLVAAPDKAVPFLKDHLHPVPRVVADRLRQLLADLDADDFARREEASRELTKLGIEIEPALRKALEGKPSLEMRRRVEALLSDLPCQTAMTPAALRQLRSIQVLEQIGSPAARQILPSLSQGAPAAPATRDAVAALQRLRRR